MTNIMCVWIWRVAVVCMWLVVRKQNNFVSYEVARGLVCVLNREQDFYFWLNARLRVDLNSCAEV